MIQLMVGNYLRYTDRSAEKEDLSTSVEETKGRLIQSLDFIPSNSRFLFCHLVIPPRLPSASKSESCRWPLCLGIRLGACLSYVILPFHSDLAIWYEDSTRFFPEYISKVRSPSQQHLAIPCDDSMFAFHCVFTSRRRLETKFTVGPWPPGKKWRAQSLTVRERRRSVLWRLDEAEAHLAWN